MSNAAHKKRERTRGTVTKVAKGCEQMRSRIPVLAAVVVCAATPAAVKSADGADAYEFCWQAGDLQGTVARCP
jgi:hypothetical protein